MSPPQVAADAPVADVFHPVIVDLAEAVRQETGLAVAHGLDGGLGQGLHPDEPLLADHGLHHVVAAIAGAHLVLEGLDGFEQAQGGQILHDGLAGLQGGHAGILAAVQHVGLVDGGLAAGEDLLGLGGVLRAGHMAVVGEHAHDGQLMALAHLKVVGIVGGGDLHHAGALFHIGVLVAHDGDLLVDQGQDHVAAVEVRIAGIGGIDGHSGIAQHGFGAGGGQFQIFPGLLDGIEQMPEVAFLLLVFHLGVGNGGIAAGAPVDQPVAAVDDVLFIQAHKDLAHSLAAALVHGEALTAPIAAGAHAAQLAADASAVLSLPGPGVLQKLLAPDIGLLDTLLGQLFHHLDLGGDGGVVGAGQPQGGIALHAMIASQGVLQGAVHGMAHVQLTGDVGRGHADGEGLFAFHAMGFESAALLPMLIGGGFDGLGIVLFLHIELFAHRFSP